MLRIGGGRIAAPAPHSSAGRHHEPNAATFRAAIGCRWLQPAPGGPQRRPGASLATPASPWPPQRRLGHASASLATPAAFRARFVGYFWRSRGQRVRGLAKEAGRDPPAEAGGAAAKSVTKTPTPAGGS